MVATPFRPPVVFDGVIDISHYQPTVDFAAIKNAGVRAVFIKATQGTQGTDPSWAQHFIAAKAAGLLVGSYHFATGDAPQAQADHLLGTIKPEHGAVVMLDFEHNPGGSTATADQVAQIGAIVAKATGRPPLIYCGRWQIATPHPVLLKWPLMLPEYGTMPICPPGWSQWLFHQYTGSGHVAGINGDVDRSVFAGTADELAAWWNPPAVVAAAIPITPPAPMADDAMIEDELIDG